MTILILVCAALSPAAFGLVPPPDGGYPGFTTADAMLLNEFLKEHRELTEEQSKVAEQQKEIDILRKKRKEQRSLLQKVSDKLDVSQSTTRVASHKP